MKLRFTLDLAGGKVTCNSFTPAMELDLVGQELPKVRRVFTVENVVIPANSEMIVKGKIDCPPPDQEVFFKPAIHMLSEDFEVETTCSIDKLEDGEIRFMVANLNPHPISLPEKLNVGQIIPFNSGQEHSVYQVEPDSLGELPTYKEIGRAHV